MADNDVITAAPAVSIANPAPLGLCGFAMTTFVLSAINAKLVPESGIFLGLAFFYGGLAQILAGMWEFKTGNTFGATAFTSYGAFWVSLAASIQFKFLPAVGTDAAVGLFLLAWTIFTAIMFLASLKTTKGLVALFGFLLVTFILLTVGKFTTGSATQIGGFFGLATAAIAWYNALAALLAGMPSAFKLPVGPIE